MAFVFLVFRKYPMCWKKMKNRSRLFKAVQPNQYNVYVCLLVLFWSIMTNRFDEHSQLVALSFTIVTRLPLLSVIKSSIWFAELCVCYDFPNDENGPEPIRLLFGRTFRRLIIAIQTQLRSIYRYLIIEVYAWEDAQLFALKCLCVCEWARANMLRFNVRHNSALQNCGLIFWNVWLIQ